MKTVSLGTKKKSYGSIRLAAAAAGVPTMKMKVQAQYLQPGDVVGSDEKVHSVITGSIQWSSSKCLVRLVSKNDPALIGRERLWGKYTEINIERTEK